MKRASLPLLLLLLLVPAGCADHSKFWIGTWSGKRGDLVLPEKNDDIAKALRYIEIKIKTDGTYEKVEAGIPDAGVANFGEKETRLTIQTRMGEPISKDPNVEKAMKELILSKIDEDTITYVDLGNPDMLPVELKRGK